MRPTAAWFAIPLLLATTPARGQFDDPKPDEPAAATPSGSSEIRDTAGMFSRDAVREGLARLIAIERSYRIPVTIETVEGLRGEPIDDAVRRFAKRLGPQAKGAFLLMAKDDHKLRVVFSRDYAAEARPKIQAIQDSFLADFAKGNFDDGLKKGIGQIETTLASLKPDEGRRQAVADRAILTFPAGRSGDETGGAASGLVRRGGIRLTLGGARRLVAAAEAKAIALGLKMNIAAVDDGGHLVAFERMDDARPASLNTAITKAISAATFRQATGPIKGGNALEAPDAILNLGLAAAASSGGGRITTLLGGVPVVVDGQTIGAVGLAGGSGEQDAEVAKAAVAAFLAEVAAAPGSSPPPR